MALVAEQSLQAGMAQQRLRQNDAPLRIEGKLMGIAKNRGGEGVVLVGEGVELIDAGGKALHQVDAAAVDCRVNKGGIDDDAVESLAGERQAKRGRH